MNKYFHQKSKSAGGKKKEKGVGDRELYHNMVGRPLHQYDTVMLRHISTWLEGSMDS